MARDALLPLAGAATLAITVGAGGVGAAVPGNGGAGGFSRVVAGAHALTAEGGPGGTGLSSTSGGRAYFGTDPAAGADFNVLYPGGSGNVGGDWGLMTGGSGLATTSGNAPAGHSALGSAPWSVASASAIGYGGGGLGAHDAAAGNGAPGIVIVEFLEAL
jgi:hypothetical protein